MSEEKTIPEWSYLFNVEDLDEGPKSVKISPDEDEVKALVKRLNLSDLSGFEADVDLNQQGQIVHVQGTLKATVTQPCVVTLDPVETKIEDDFEAWYADPEAATSIAKARREREMKKGKSDLPMLEENEDPEAIINGEIDLGELATQYLSLSINPYVHKEGVEYEYGDDEDSPSPSEVRNNPFEALKEWKDKLK